MDKMNSTGAEEISTVHNTNSVEITSSRISFWKVTIWVLATLGLSFFAAYQLIGGTTLGNYEERATLHETPGLLGTISGVLNGPWKSRSKREADDQNWENPDNQSEEQFWDTIFQDVENNEDSQLANWTSEEFNSSTVVPFFTTPVSEDSTPSPQSYTSNETEVTNSTAPLTQSVSPSATEIQNQSESVVANIGPTNTMDFFHTSPISSHVLITESQQDISPSHTLDLPPETSIVDNPVSSAITSEMMGMEQPTEEFMEQDSNWSDSADEFNNENTEQDSEGLDPFLGGWLDEQYNTPNNDWTEDQLNETNNQPLDPLESKSDGEDPCYAFSYEIANVCEMSDRQLELFGEDPSMEDITAAIFDSTVVDTLMSDCSNGTWCLGTTYDKDMYEYVNHSVMELCPMVECLMDVPDMCISEERRITMSTLMLLCKTAGTDSTSPTSCVRSIMKMSHVTMANWRLEQNGENQGICDESEKYECTGTCKQFAQQLRCMCTTCEHRYYLFDEYGPWQWYFTMENSMDKCNLISIDCTMFEDSSVSLYQGWWSRMETMDSSIISAVTLACVITVTGIVAMIIMCIKKSPKYQRKEVEYRGVNYDDDDDDDENVLAQFIP